MSPVFPPIGKQHIVHRSEVVVGIDEYWKREPSWTTVTFGAIEPRRNFVDVISADADVGLQALELVGGVAACHKVIK